MKLFVEITEGSAEQSPVKIVIEKIAKAVGYEVVDSHKSAELIVTDSFRQALDWLKNTSAHVAVSVYNEHDRLGAEGLERNFPGRTTCCPLIDKERNVAIFLITFKGDKDENPTS